MPAILRSRLALLALLGAFLIPIGMSGLRGLTHVLTCSEQAEQPFTVVITDGQPQVLSSIRIGAEDTGRVCGGLAIDTQASSEEGNKITMIFPITNHTENPWRGTVSALIGKTAIPIEIGEIPAGQTVVGEVDFELDEGTTDINGSLLLGP